MIKKYHNQLNSGVEFDLIRAWINNSVIGDILNKHCLCVDYGINQQRAYKLWPFSKPVVRLKVCSVIIWKTCVISQQAEQAETGAQALSVVS